MCLFLLRIKLMLVGCQKPLVVWRSFARK